MKLPDGTWACDDDARSLDPSITLENPAAGEYDIWVGSGRLSLTAFIGTLGIERPE